MFPFSPTKIHLLNADKDNLTSR